MRLFYREERVDMRWMLLLPLVALVACEPAKSSKVHVALDQSAGKT
jgi:hypothetical protein